MQNWVGHVEYSSDAVRTACDTQVDGRWAPGRTKLTWKKLAQNDYREWKLTTVDTQERSTWRSGVRSATRAASQLHELGPADVDYTNGLHVYQKSDCDMIPKVRVFYPYNTFD